MTDPVYPLAFDTWEDEEREALDAVIASGRFTMGERVRGFEADLARELGVRRCVMVNSGSSANLLAAAALRYGPRSSWWPGAEVIVPAVGWATTYFPFAQLGYRLRLVDVDPATLNLDPVELAAAITDDTAAVVVVNALGNPCDFAGIRAAITDAGARSGRSLPLLEDNCESLGATADGRACGTFGLAGTFSFFYSHHISTMEGGALCTDDDELADVLVALRAHGWTRDLPPGSALAAPGIDPFEAAFHFVLPGFNVRPLELSGAVGSVPYYLGGMVQRWQTLQDTTAPIVPPYDRDPQWSGRFALTNVQGLDYSVDLDATRFVVCRYHNAERRHAIPLVSCLPHFHFKDRPALWQISRAAGCRFWESRPA